MLLLPVKPTRVIGADLSREIATAIRIKQGVNTMRIFAALGMTALLGLFSFRAHAAGLPVVISATVDYTHNTLTISGQNFGSHPSVTLDALAFTTQSSGSSQIVANFPGGKAPSSFTPGTYFLTVTFKNQLPTIFGVDIGANGATGQAGPAGAPGAPGVAGAPGPAGPAGAQGIPGPVGATGPAGTMGASGLPGVAGAQGLQGPQGPMGAVGPQGPAGAGINSLSALNNLPCTVGSYQGTTNVGIGATPGNLAFGNIAVSIICKIPPFTPPANAVALGTLSPGGSTEMGRPYSASTAVDDWYVVSFSAPSSPLFNPQMTVTATDPAITLDVVGDFGSFPVVFIGAQLGTQFPTANGGPYLVRVYGLPTTSGNYELSISN
jgi:hypothetical protein